MTLRHLHLEALTRSHMVAELRDDVARGRLYMSPWLTPGAQEQLAAVLEVVLDRGTDEALAEVFTAPGVLQRFERTSKGDPTRRPVPKAAPQILAEFLVNRYVVRGVCRRALEEGIATVEVYRAREARNPRPASEKLIGALVDAKELLDDLRDHASELEGRFGVPAIGSGLSVRLVSPDV